MHIDGRPITSTPPYGETTALGPDNGNAIQFGQLVARIGDTVLFDTVIG